MPSTVIRSFQYAADRGELLIEFQSGRRYVYLDVPEPVYAAMKRAFAKGEFFNSRIRNHYRFEQRSEHD